MRAGVLLCAVGFVAIVGLAKALPVGQTLIDQELNSGLEPADSGGEYVRDKRTVGVLRDLFPNFSQFVDRAIQMITRLLFRVIGRVVLQGGGGILGGGGGGGGAGGGAAGGGGESRISITLPTYPPLPDDDEETPTEESPSTDQDGAAAGSSDSTTPSPADEQENSVAESQLNPVRAKREADKEAEAEEEEDDAEEDLEEQATGDNNEVAEGEEADETDPENEDASAEEDPRNKRFLNFNLAGGADAHGTTGGSGNFIFDVIRRSADRAARMAGTVYRVLAGTDDLGLPTYPPPTEEALEDNSTIPLIAGSGTSEAQDEAANSPAGDGKAHYGVGVPGPLTRLFVIANRGVANLIQDLILRMAQTSERLVNFKARLITSLI